MKNYILSALFSFSVAILGFSNPIIATDIEVDIAAGEQVFSANCAACHSGGGNVIITEKTLQKETLEANGMDNTKSIIYQVVNGKNAMPAFGGRLQEDQILNVASYVLDQSTKGW